MKKHEKQMKGFPDADALRLPFACRRLKQFLMTVTILFACSRTLGEHNVVKAKGDTTIEGKCTKTWHGVCDTASER